MLYKFKILFLFISFLCFYNINKVYSYSIEERLVDPDLLVRNEALKEIRNNKEAAIPKLKIMLKNNNSEIRDIAVQQLGYLKTNDAIDEMIDILKNDSEKTVRQSTVYSLIKIKAKVAIPVMLKILKDSNEYEDRMMAIIGLGNILEKNDSEYINIINAFKEALNDSSGYVRMRAAYMLGKFGYDLGYEKAKKEFLYSEDKLTRDYALNALGEIGKIESIKLIEDIIKNDKSFSDGKKVIKKIEYKNLIETSNKNSKLGIMELENIKIEYLKNLIMSNDDSDIQRWVANELIKIDENGVKVLKNIANSQNSGQEIAIKILLFNNIEINTIPKNVEKSNELLKAMIDGMSEEKIKLLINQGADVNIQSIYLMNTTPLHLAIANGKIGIVKLLLDNGANVNIKMIDSRYGDITPLFSAIFSNNAEIVKLLINNGADINMKIKEELSALHAAVLMENIEIIEILIKKEMDVNITANKGYTPLGLAKQKGNKKIIEILTSLGAK